MDQRTNQPRAEPNRRLPKSLTGMTSFISSAVECCFYVTNGHEWYVMVTNEAGNVVVGCLLGWMLSFAFLCSHATNQPTQRRNNNGWMEELGGAAVWSFGCFFSSLFPFVHKVGQTVGAAIAMARHRAVPCPRRGPHILNTSELVMSTTIPSTSTTATTTNATLTTTRRIV